VFVHPEVEGAGLATELCRHAIASAADADRDALLDVARRNHRAIRLYRRLGFEAVDFEESGVSAGDSTRMRLDLRREVATDVRLPLGVGDARLRYLFKFIIYL
jgi:ribosomal protein S18 acetylase RimI-like enzyme